MGNAARPGAVPRPASVHPHVHGERRGPRPHSQVVIGSSPRAWGTLDPEAPDQVHKRFIPTCMGNAGRRRCGSGCPSVHPHVHGERSGSWSWATTRRGSSPRAWGTQNVRHAGIRRDRFIPTCMGNAPEGVFYDVSYSGSSPRAWGTPGSSPSGGACDRFIPTCMGNAHPRPPILPPIPVHPHVHGERIIPANNPVRVFGSSPRAWGTLHLPPHQDPDRRFIPTCMGNA